MKLALRIGGGLLVILLIAGVIFKTELGRLYGVLTLFEADNITENFQHMDNLFDTATVSAAPTPHKFAEGPQVTLPNSFNYEGQEIETEAFLGKMHTDSMLVLQNGQVVFEQYWPPMQADSRHIFWSVTKSVVSALFGIAHHDGLIPDLMAPVDQYVPALKGSGYEGVPIKHVLQMSSGIKFNEDYGDLSSDINRMGQYLALGTPLIEFIRSLENEREPGTFNQYVSMDTQVLTEVLIAATGKPLETYLEEQLWHPLGMNDDAEFMVDDAGTALGFGGLNASTRDLARFGQLFLQNGEWNGQQLIDPQWIFDSTTPDAPHLMPGKDNKLSDYGMGYGYQWWLPPVPKGDFLGIGVYGQFVYINRIHNVVIVKFSSYPEYTEDEESEYQTVALFQAIAAAVTEQTRP